jgi:hypothetical protein
MSNDRAVTVGLLAAGVVVGGLLSMVSAFYVPTRAGVVSLGDVLAVVTIGPYAHFVGRAARSSAAGALPAVAWLGTTMYFATLRPEGDLIVTGSAYGLAFLLLGTLSGAVGIGTIRSSVQRDDQRAAERAALAAVPPDEGEH